MSLFEYPGNNVIVDNGHLVITYPIYINGVSDISRVKREIEESSCGETDLIDSYRVQSDRTFKRQFLDNITRFELPEQEVVIDDSFDEAPLDAKMILSLHEEEHICLMTIWVDITQQWNILEYINTKRKIDDEGETYIRIGTGDKGSPTNYLSKVIDDVELTASNFNYSLLLVSESSIKNNLTEICENGTDYEWEGRQLYALITGNSLQWCRGMRLEEVEKLFSQEIDWRIETFTWVQKFSSTILFSEVPNSYIRQRADQVGEPFKKRLRHTISYEVIVGEFLILRAAIIGRYQKKITGSIKEGSQMDLNEIISLRENILSYFEEFSSERSLQEYLDNRDHFRKIASASDIDTLEENLSESLTLLESSIQNKRALMESRRDFNIQFFLVIAETVILVSVVNSLLQSPVKVTVPLLNGPFEMGSLLVSVIVSLGIMAVIFIFDLQSLLQEYIIR